LVNTAIEAYELPKFIPITGGRDDTSVGSRFAVPFGGAFEAIVVVEQIFFVPRSPGPDTSGLLCYVESMG
jgi:hypothetical protein